MSNTIRAYLQRWWEQGLLFAAAPLLIDFGTTGSPASYPDMAGEFVEDVSITSAAHQSGGLANTFNTYNNVGADHVLTGLAYGDNSPATGVALEWGRSATRGGRIAFGDNTGLTVHAGVDDPYDFEYNNPVYRDVVRGTAAAGEQAVRITGLAAGTYRVYFTADHAMTFKHYFSVQIGKNLLAMDHQVADLQISASLNGSFTSPSDFISRTLTIEAGDDITVIVDKHYDHAYQLFNVLEVVPVDLAPEPPEVASPVLGVYRGGANAAKVDLFAAWANQPLVWAEDFLDRKSWSDITNDWFMERWGDWKSGRSQRQLIVSVPMLPESETAQDESGGDATDGAVPDLGQALEDGANGDFNAYFVEVAENLAAEGLADGAVVRLGWEFNGTWYPWAAEHNPEAFVDYWHEIVTAMRGVTGAAGLTFCWNPNSGHSNVAKEDAYPAFDADVDAIGVDVYDQSWSFYPWPSTATADEVRVRQEKAVYETLSADDGLMGWAKFAWAKNKPLMLPEWGLFDRRDGHGGMDNPLFVRMIHAFVSDPGMRVAMHTYFEIGTGPDVEDSEGDHRISPLDGTHVTAFPKSALEFQRLFSAPRGQLAPVDDTFVRGGGYANTSYGDQEVLTVKEDAGDGFDRRALLKFDLSDLSDLPAPPDPLNPGTTTGAAARIADAYLELHVDGGGSDVAQMWLEVRLVLDDSWEESTATWNTKPADTLLLEVIPGERLASGSGVVKVPLASIAESQRVADGVLSLMLVATNGEGSQRYVDFVSQQGPEGQRPKLVIRMGTPQTYEPVSDAQVRGGSHASTNYGAATVMEVKNDYYDAFDRVSLLQFDLSSQSAPAGSALLELPVISLDTEADEMLIEVQVLAGDDWTETGLTWANQPMAATTVATIAGPELATGLVRVDLGAAVNTEILTDGRLSLRLEAVNDYVTEVNNQRIVAFGTREQADPALRPRLILR